MNRASYLALTWPPGRAEAVARAAHLARCMDADPAWRRRACVAGLTVCTRGAAEIPFHRLGDGGVALGTLRPLGGDLGAAAGRASTAREGGPVAKGRTLSQTHWGGYVAVWPATDAAAAGLYREPSGALEASAWSLGEGVWAVGRDFTALPPGVGPRRLALDWERIAVALGAPWAATGRSLFDDVADVGPGEVLTLAHAAPGRDLVWDPSAFAGPAPDLRSAATAAVRAVDEAVLALLPPGARAVAELSGGLDSSIVAGALAATGRAGAVSRWVTFRHARPEADEGRYARAVTGRIGVRLHELPLRLAPLTEADFREIAGFSRPAVGGADASRDRAELAQLRAAGAGALISGQGGDGAFFQFPSPLVLTDAWRARGPAALFGPLPANLARRMRRPVWGVLREAWAGLRRPGAYPVSASALLTPEVAALAREAEHPWLRAGRDRGLPPGKLLHLKGAAVTHLYRGQSRRGAEAEIVLPLFTQPLLELCLSIPTWDLAGAAYDRPFARAAFGDRLPGEVVARRDKGDMSAYFAQLVAVSLEFLRPYLLDGCLCEAGLLDRARLDRLLEPTALMWGLESVAADVLMAAAVEAWVRHWQGRAPDSLSAPRRRPA